MILVPLASPRDENRPHAPMHRPMTMRRFTAILSILLTFAFLTTVSAMAQHGRHHAGQEHADTMALPDSMSGVMQNEMKHGLLGPDVMDPGMSSGDVQSSNAWGTPESAASAARLSGHTQFDRRKANREVGRNNVFVMMGPSNTISVIDLDNGEVAGLLPAKGNPHGGALTPDGNRIYAASMNTERMTVVDPNSEEVITRIDLGAMSHHIGIRQDGSYVYAAAGQVKVIDTSINEVTASIETTDPPFHPVLSPDGRTLYVLNRGTTVSVIDTESNTVTHTIEMGSRSIMGHLAFAPDGETLYATNDADGTLSIIDVSKGQLRTGVPVGRRPHGVAVSTDGGRVYVSDRGGRLAVVDSQTHEVIATRDLGGSPEHLSMTTDGDYLIVGLKNRFPGDEGTSQGSSDKTDAIAVIDSRSLNVIEEIPVWAQVHDILVPQSGE